MSSLFSLCIDHCEVANGFDMPLVCMNGVYASWKDDLNIVLFDINCAISKVTVNSQFTCIIITTFCFKKWGVILVKMILQTPTPSCKL